MKRSAVFALSFLLAIFASTPALAKWDRQYSCSGAKNNLFSVGAFDETKATTGGQSNASGQDTPVLLTTQNGDTWTEGNFEGQPTALIFYPWVLSTPSSKTGYMSMLNLGITSQADLETSSNGLSWTLYKGTIPGAKGAQARTIYFSDPQNGWYLGAASWANWLVRTTDAAATWDALTLAYEQDIGYNGLFFINDKVGWAAGGDYGEVDDQGNVVRPPGKGVIQYTTDGGKTWKKAVSERPYAFDAITFGDCQNGWVTAHDGNKGHILHSTDGGKTWKEQTVPKNSVASNADFSSFPAIRFFDANEGWAIGNVDQSTPGGDPQYAAGMLHTTDGGKTWKQDTTYNDGAKADNGSACCLPDPQACKMFGPLSGQAHGGFSMDWPTRNTGWVVGSNMIVMKYTADTPSTKAGDRCVECGGGECHGEPVQPDAGPGDDAGPTDGPIVGPDGEIPDAGPEDTGPADTGPTNIIPTANLKLCFSKDAPAGTRAFETVVSYAERKVTGDLDLYIFPGSSTVLMTDARATAQADGDGTVGYIHTYISVAYAISGVTMQAADGDGFVKIKSSDATGQLLEKDLYLNISGLSLDLTTVDGTPAGTAIGEMKIPVLAGPVVSSIATKTLSELFNTIREPCPEDKPDAATATDAPATGEDGAAAGADTGTGGAATDVPAGEPSGGCTCAVAGGAPTARTAALLMAPFLGLLAVLLFLGRGRNVDRLRRLTHRRETWPRRSRTRSS
ncbi:MAG: hypothetical protein HY897_08800 [Deltaproteobacteria bacterium]|nr:hypothetical protein [Deltaproteobacteria bacterium]